jgi:hypothetical protein
MITAAGLSIAALLTASPADAAAAASLDAAPSAVAPGAGASAVASREAETSVVAPAVPTEMTRLELKFRPFLGLTGNSWGGIGEARLEHYFRAPFMLGLELSPLAVANSGEGTGAIAQARVHGAYVNHYFAVGLGLGGQLQRFGRSGLSIAPTLRLGSLDGLNLSIEYAYSIAPNQYTGQRTIGFSNLLATLDVPLARRLALELDSGIALQSWAFATAGLRYRLVGDGGPGSWFVTGAFGGAWITDRNSCNYNADIPCGNSAVSFGPTVMFGLERRF